MSHRRIPKRRAIMAGAGVAALVIAGITFQTANASPSAPTSALTTLSAAKASDLASTLTTDLGKSAAGTYYDAATKHLVVNVLNASSARTVEAAGARAKIVQHSLAELNSVGDTLKAHSTAGTSWMVDPTTDKLVVTADRTVTGARLDQLTQRVRSFGDRAVLKRTTGEYKRFIAGGDAISDPSIGRCSLGFNVTVGGQPAFLTAGHCTEAISTWSDSSGSVIGQNIGSSFPGNDYGVVRFVSGVAHPSQVDLYNGSAQSISRAANPTVGEQVRRSGSTTHVHAGRVTGLNATVDYGGGDIVQGLIDTNVCAEPGDSGGPLFDGSTALGLTSGGSGDCSSGGETFFQPVPEVLKAFGATIG